MALVRARTTITKTGKAAREDAAAFQKAVIAEEKALIAITEGEETRLLALRDAWDAARAAEKAEAERIERLRIEQIHLRIADIREAGNLALQCRTSAMVESLIEKMTGQVLDGFDEFTEEAENTRTVTLARMKEISDIKLAEEQERARIKAEQEAEAARLAAERAENARIAAELERQRAEFQAEQERRAAEVKALETVVTEIDPEKVEATGPAPLATTDTDPFQQADGSDELDGPQEPSDADVIAWAAASVADRFGMSFNEALNRLAEVQEWIAVEVTT